MDDNASHFLGVLSGAFSLSAYAVYVVATLRRVIRPQRTSWTIWAVLSSLGFASLWYEAAGPWLWFSGAQAAGTVTVAVLAIFLGRGRFMDRREALVLMAAGSGLWLWYLTDEPAYALVISIVVGFLGGLATVVDAFRQPVFESMEMWFVSWIAAGLGLLSVGALDWLLLAYPLYLFTLYALILLAIRAGRLRAARGVTVAVIEPRVPAG